MNGARLSARRAPRRQAAARARRSARDAMRAAQRREGKPNGAAARARSGGETARRGGPARDGASGGRAPKARPPRTPRRRERPAPAAQRGGAKGEPRGPRATAAGAQRSSPRAEGEQPKRRGARGAAEPPERSTFLAASRSFAKQPHGGGDGGRSPSRADDATCGSAQPLGAVFGRAQGKQGAARDFGTFAQLGTFPRVICSPAGAYLIQGRYYVNGIGFGLDLAGFYHAQLHDKILP